MSLRAFVGVREEKSERPASPAAPSPGGRKLMVLDTTYSLATIRSRGLEMAVIHRDLDGFFEHVWSVHPLVGASPDHDPATAVGPTSSTLLAPRHTVIEGRVARFQALGRLPALNFLLAQAELTWILHRVIRQECVAAIGASDPYYTGLLGLILARTNGIPLFLTVGENFDRSFAEHGKVTYPRLFRRRSVEKRIERAVFPRVDTVFVGSWDNHNYARDNGAREERIVHVRWGDLIHPAHQVAPAERSSVRSELGVGDSPFLLFVGRLEPVKRPQDILVVLAEARRSYPTLKAVLVGDGAMRPELAARAAELGISDHVVFAGTRDQLWIASALSEAAVILSPLTGRALIESSLSGTPIVAYDTEWQSEFFESDHNGILVPFRDTTQMAAAVCQILGDQSRAERLATTARRRTVELWNAEANISERRVALAQLTDRPRRHRW